METRITDPVLIEQCMKNLSEYGYEEEIKNFEETFSEYVGFNSQWSYEEGIEYIEGIPGGTSHILYSMLVIKAYLNFDDSKSK